MRKIEFESLKIRRATDIIENRISNMIIKGNIKPGEKLPTEKELSDQFNVSIVTIREALRGLEVAGLIEKKRGKGGGIYVTETDNDSVKISLHNFLKRRDLTPNHLAQVRLTMEPTMVKIAVDEITPEELSVLENNLNYCQEKLEKTEGPLQPKDFQSLGEKNLEFHRLIAEATHNPVFAFTTDYLLDFIFYFKKTHSSETEWYKRIIDDHRTIFTAIKNGAAEEAGTKMYQHLKNLELLQIEEE